MLGLKLPTDPRWAEIAEKSIAELGVMFHKMSSLIVAQGETLERIEDDVESAGLDIDAGHDELVKVYGMTKGNRGLILKVFGVLIFLIIFMKLY
ncbi:MAG: syntaxin-5 family protein [Bacteroidota bacterium]